MAIQRKVFERVLNMAQMHNAGVLTAAPNMNWTCRWKEGGRESSISYQIVRAQQDESLNLRLKYQSLRNGNNEWTPVDYTIPIKVSLSYKRKNWYWFVCPLTINGKPCRRRVRNLYFLPNSDYFGCKYCRDMMIRSLKPELQYHFRQTALLDTKSIPGGGGGGGSAKANAAAGFVPDMHVGWQPAGKRRICAKCGCQSEGQFCCNCGTQLADNAMPDLFEILGIIHTASEEQIRAAFKMRQKEYHPDRVAHLGPKIQKVAAEEIKRVNLAYEVLVNPARRQAYLRQYIKKKRS